MDQIRHITTEILPNNINNAKQAEINLKV